MDEESEMLLDCSRLNGPGYAMLRRGDINFRVMLGAKIVHTAIGGKFRTARRGARLPFET